MVPIVRLGRVLLRIGDVETAVKECSGVFVRVPPAQRPFVKGGPLLVRDIGCLQIERSQLFVTPSREYFILAQGKQVVHSVCHRLGRAVLHCGGEDDGFPDAQCLQMFRQPGLFLHCTRQAQKGHCVLVHIITIPSDCIVIPDCWSWPGESLALCL